MSSAVETLSAVHEINEVLRLYCRSMDRVDVDLGYRTWHDDGTAEYLAHSREIYKGTGHGFIDWITVYHRGLINHTHRISNPLVDVRGDRAASETYVIAVHLLRDDQSAILRTYHGRYLDRWSKRDGRWAIDARRFLSEFSFAQRVSEDLEGTDLTSPGFRDRRDPSYALFSK